ncbi:hydroxyacylglutathione hydrolase [Pseudomonas sp. S34]|uniref:hydroxyacylglutathione hydrolase n=1 Tax=Pseudomonas sp. S34 TaxID=1573718 RepID=UPI00132F1D92|nr:hydroxyacylglutathione hydrolase [Pseudomonas sp. S34]QHF39083.1 hydroxyacylglutathione hydrolase [Pseudomonas sp. S34]
MIQITALPAFTDNYIWLLQDHGSKRCAVVDPGDAGPVQAWLSANPGWVLSDILITHHHHDHVGGVEQLKKATDAKVYGPASETIPARDVALKDNDKVHVLGWDFDVLAVPGHTLGHIAYYHHGLLFCGDTLFAAGCGRLFEGTPQQMYSSLTRLAGLPEDTLVYCTHEYTLGNLKFAATVEPNNPHIAERLAKVTRQRESGIMTLPSTLALEKLTNPFLRSGETSVKEKADERTGTDNSAPDMVFAALRAWKDRF